MTNHALPARSGSAAPALVLDSAERIIYGNEAAQHVFGTCMLEALNDTFEQLLAERSRAAFRSALAPLRDATELSVFLGTASELYCRRDAGGEFPVELCITGLQIGQTRGYVVALHDVTAARRRARDNQFLADLGCALGASLDANHILRAFARRCAAHFKRCCVVAIDETDAHPPLLEIAYRDAAGSDVVHIEPTPFLPPGLRTVIEELGSRRAGGAATHAGVRGAASHKAPHAYAEVAAPIRIRGAPVGVVLLVSLDSADEPADKALARRAAARLAAALDNAGLYAAARQSLRAHDEMLSFVSHDLRNPLNVIMMAASFLKERDVDDEFTVHWVDAILHGAEQMNTLIADLLTDARVQSGGPALRRDAVGAASLIREACNAHEAVAERKGTRLIFHVEDETLHVNADSGAMIRALSNLIGNAVKHTPAGGTVTVSAAAGDEDVVHFCVEDTGTGIAAELLPHVFERFWQAPDAGSSGTGLGLAIVKSVVEAHGGRVWVESDVGHGCRFHFTLPAAPHTELTAADHP